MLKTKIETVILAGTDEQDAFGIAAAIAASKLLICTKREVDRSGPGSPRLITEWQTPAASPGGNQ